MDSLNGFYMITASLMKRLRRLLLIMIIIYCCVQQRLSVKRKKKVAITVIKQGSENRISINYCV